MASTEIFVITALPEGIEGNKLRLAVLVSPRLLTDEPGQPALDNWPDARDWPSINPTWEVTITPQGGTPKTLPANELPSVQGFEFAAWQQMFPGTMPTKPYKHTDRSEAPIFSYPVAKVVQAARDIHVQVLADSRTEFPATDDLLQNPAFLALLQAADPATGDAVCEMQRNGPVSDASVTLAQAFAMVDCFHGVRPGSEPPPGPVIVELDPNGGTENGGTPVEISGSGFTGATEVKFGDDTATFQVVNDSTITCTSPEYTGPPIPTNEHVDVTVTVTTPFGTSPASPASTFSYLGPIVK